MTCTTTDMLGLDLKLGEDHLYLLVNGNSYGCEVVYVTKRLPSGRVTVTQVGYSASRKRADEVRNIVILGITANKKAVNPNNLISVDKKFITSLSASQQRSKK